MLLTKIAKPGLMISQTWPNSRQHQGQTLRAIEAAAQLVAALQQLELPTGISHLTDHLRRAADNTVLRLAEASGRTMGNRYQHIEAAYAENQEVQSVLFLMRMRGARIPDHVLDRADRVGGLVYGLLRSEVSRSKP